MGKYNLGLVWITLICISLINFSCNINYHVKKLEVETTYCEGNCPVFKMILNNDRSALYEAIDYNKDKGTFKTNLKVEDSKKLFELLNKTNFPRLKDNYAIQKTDYPSIILTIYYDKGSQKKIVDYGQQGTKSLKELYTFIFTLRESQNWKSINNK